ncbi:GTP-binding protein Rho1, partial [Entophlyctis luteolus]
MSLWDTAGQEDYDRLRPLSYTDADVVLIAFAVDSRQTLDNILTKWIGEVRHYAPGVPTILVACKTDMRQDKSANCTTFEQGKSIAQQIDATYAECSALTGAGVLAVFEAAARLSAAHSAMKRKGRGRGGGAFEHQPKPQKTSLLVSLSRYKITLLGTNSSIEQYPMFLAPVKLGFKLGKTSAQLWLNSDPQQMLSANDQPGPRKKLVVVGDGACGKTCLLPYFHDHPLCLSRPVHDALIILRNALLTLLSSIPTVFANYVADLVVDGTRMQLSLWDTAGQEDYDRLRPLSYPDSHVVLICYAVDSPVSLANIKEKWISEVLHYCRGVPIVLVACKADLRHDPQIIQALAMENERPVTYEEGKRVAQQIGAVGFVECSARTGQGVKE